MAKVKPVAKDDYWNSGGFGDDFDDIPEAHISDPNPS